MTKKELKPIKCKICKDTGYIYTPFISTPPVADLMSLEPKPRLLDVIKSPCRCFAGKRREKWERFDREQKMNQQSLDKGEDD